MPDWPLSVQRAQLADKARVIGLIDEAAAWLRKLETDQWSTDQWARPWPSRRQRNRRVKRAIRDGLTWICWDRGTPAATLTADTRHDPYWDQDEQSTPAVYVHRLVVARDYAGLGLGASLLSWAGRTGRLAHGAQCIRISAWTTNDRLHQYYNSQGFVRCGSHADPAYPSGARFEKLTSQIPYCWAHLFTAPNRLIDRSSHPRARCARLSRRH
jgi:GNAT superfamily N-acetyltransferase